MQHKLYVQVNKMTAVACGALDEADCYKEGLLQRAWEGTLFRYWMTDLIKVEDLATFFCKKEINSVNKIWHSFTLVCF